MYPHSMLNRIVIKTKYNFNKPLKEYHALVFYSSCYLEYKIKPKVSVNCRLPYGYFLFRYMIA